MPLFCQKTDQNAERKIFHKHYKLFFFFLCKFNSFSLIAEKRVNFFPVLGSVSCITHTPHSSIIKWDIFSRKFRLNQNESWRSRHLHLLLSLQYACARPHCWRNRFALQKAAGFITSCFLYQRNIYDRAERFPQSHAKKGCLTNAVRQPLFRIPITWRSLPFRTGWRRQRDRGWPSRRASYGSCRYRPASARA